MGSRPVAGTLALLVALAAVAAGIGYLVAGGNRGTGLPASSKNQVAPPVASTVRPQQQTPSTPPLTADNGQYSAIPNAPGYGPPTPIVRPPGNGGSATGPGYAGFVPSQVPLGPYATAPGETIAPAIPQNTVPPGATTLVTNP